jgi:hypothetical protein
MKLSTLQQTVAAEQKRMGLLDWTIKAVWAAPGDIAGTSEAEIGVESVTERTATIYFEKPKRGAVVDLCVIRHELAHVYFAPFYIPPNDLNEERACWAIARALNNPHTA